MEHNLEEPTGRDTYVLSTVKNIHKEVMITCQYGERKHLFYLFDEDRDTMCDDNMDAILSLLRVWFPKSSVWTVGVYAGKEGALFEETEIIVENKGIYQEIVPQRSECFYVLIIWE